MIEACYLDYPKVYPSNQDMRTGFYTRLLFTLSELVALHYAYILNMPTLATHLIQAGASATLPSFEELAPRDYAGLPEEIY